VASPSFQITEYPTSLQIHGEHLVLQKRCTALQEQHIALQDRHVALQKRYIALHKELEVLESRYISQDNTQSITETPGSKSDCQSEGCESIESLSSSEWTDDEHDFPAVLKEHQQSITEILIQKFKTSNVDEPSTTTSQGVTGQSNLRPNSATQVSSSSSKRSWDDRRDASDEEEPGKREIKKLKVDEEDSGRLLACPFCKLDPLKYKDCLKYTLRGMNRVK
jgi:hypothetical protein